VDLEDGPPLRLAQDYVKEEDKEDEEEEEEEDVLLQHVQDLEVADENNPQRRP
jgi:hypothetical protein